MNTKAPSAPRVPPSSTELQFQYGHGTETSYVLNVDGRIQKSRQYVATLPPGSKILDIGCADGSILGPFSKTHELHGVDCHEEYTQMAFVRNNMKGVVHDISAAPLPYADGEFDGVFSGETIEHQVDTDWFLAEVNRVLKIGGTFVLTMPNVRTMLSLGMMVLLDMPPKFSARYRGPHYRDFTLKLGKIALQNHGFEIQKYTGGNIHIPGLGPTASGLASLFPSWADTIIFLAVKRATKPYSLEEASNTDVYGLFGPG